MASCKIVDEIRKRFRFLFDAHGFALASEICFDSFENWVVVLKSKECRLRIFQDRGEVTIAVGPLWSPSGWQSGPWFDLAIVIRYVSQGKDQWEYEGGNTDEQLKRLAEKLRPYCQQICWLFREDVFPEKRQELEKMQAKLDREFWKSLTNPD